jgi:hypothetical protein
MKTLKSYENFEFFFNFLNLEILRKCLTLKQFFFSLILEF